MGASVKWTSTGSGCCWRIGAYTPDRSVAFTKLPAGRCTHWLGGAGVAGAGRPTVKTAIRLGSGTGGDATGGAGGAGGRTGAAGIAGGGGSGLSSRLRRSRSLVDIVASVGAGL